MNEKVIRIAKIDKYHSNFSIYFEFTDNLSCYFRENHLDINILKVDCVEDIPDSILVIPFICNVLPIVWLTNAKLFINELDRSFYECISNIKNAYSKMFPESEFLGSIKVDKIVECDRLGEKDNVAMFYSGGLDSVNTFVKHCDEKPDLISIWGSDIKYDNQEGWDIVHKNIENTAKKYNLNDVVIHSSFREFDNEGNLDRDFHEQLKDGWWHGAKHGLALLGHVAPYAYLHNISTMYIASSYSINSEPVRCASHPTIDNNVKFANCNVIHDGYEYNRQDKIRNVIEYCKLNNTKFPLHVCWTSQTGENCCKCEKCYRTILGLIVEGENPIDYGFYDFSKNIKDIRKTIYLMRNTEIVKICYSAIKKRAIENINQIKNSPYWKDIKWIMNVDFNNPETITPPLGLRIRTKLSEYKFYQLLHKLKELLK